MGIICRQQKNRFNLILLYQKAHLNYWNKKVFKQFISSFRDKLTVLSAFSITNNKIYKLKAILLKETTSEEWKKRAKMRCTYNYFSLRWKIFDLNFNAIVCLRFFLSCSFLSFTELAFLYLYNMPSTFYCVYSYQQHRELLNALKTCERQKSGQKMPFRW